MAHAGFFRPVSVDTASVTVKVAALPARFWRFELRRVGMSPMFILTGSGTFDEMWNRYAQPFLDGMFTVNKE